MPDLLNTRTPSMMEDASTESETGAPLLDRNAAVAAGCDFLKRQLRAGRWGLSCHGSDGTPRFSHDKGHLFAGFFIAQALATDLDETERALLLVRLLTEESAGHWGYSPRGYAPGPEDNPHFVDADDTAFALRTFRHLGVYRSPKSLLHFFRQRWRWTRGRPSLESGFVTFATTKKPILACAVDHTANFEMHPEVNANVFHALLDTNEQKYINTDLIDRSQRPDGSWYSFFYPSRFYSAFHFMELIKRLDGFEGHAEKCRHFLTKTQNANGSWGEDGDAYETALAVRALASHTPEADEVSRGIRFLVSAQSEDGSWHSNSIIWEFRSDAADTWQSRDVNDVITTALCVAALRCAA